MLFFHVITFFFFNDTATTEIYTLSLHDALPILTVFSSVLTHRCSGCAHSRPLLRDRNRQDRKSTRLNSSHSQISYAGLCLKKKRGLLAVGLVRMEVKRVAVFGVRASTN